MKNGFKKIALFLLFSHFSMLCFADELIIEPEDGRTPLLTAITHASSSVNLSLYGLTDPLILQSLLTAKKIGKNIRVLLEPHPYQTEDENENAIQLLQQAQIPIHWPSTQFKFLHQKTLLLDQNSAIIMTFNLTQSAFKNERNFGILITNPAMVEEIQSVFDADWSHKLISVQNPNLVWSPDNSRIKILSLIKQARSSIKIYTQTLTDYEVINALANAARGNIKVQILLSNPPKPSCFRYLKQAGVEIHVINTLYIHAKVFLIDQKRAMMGSINLTRSSLDENRELSVITDDKKIIHRLSDLFDHDLLSSI